MLAEISDQAAKLMGEAVRNLTGVVDKVAKTANETYDSGPRNTGYGQAQSVPMKRGLSSTDRQSLEDVIATCKDIEKAAEQLCERSEEKGRLRRRAGDASGRSRRGRRRFHRDRPAAGVCAEHARENILNGDYSDRSNNPAQVEISSSNSRARASATSAAKLVRDAIFLLRPSPTRRRVDGRAGRQSAPGPAEPAVHSTDQLGPGLHPGNALAS